MTDVHFSCEEGGLGEGGGVVRRMEVVRVEVVRRVDVDSMVE